MPTANLPIIPPTLPEGWCPSDLQEFVNETVGKAIVQFTSQSFSVLLVQASAPDATDRDKPWLKTGDDRIYRWFGGAWVSRNPEAPSGIARRMVVGSTAAIQTYDGGDTDPAGAASGPMWEVDTEFEGRVPVGVGTIPGSNPVVTLAVGDNGGVAQTAAILPEHYHFIANDDVVSSGAVPPTDSTFVAQGADYQGSSGVTEDDYRLAGTSTEPTLGRTSTAGEADANISAIQPVRAVYFIKRTSRVYYRGA
jgi:hypothetical protein